jgi:hypothetical protein
VATVQGHALEVDVSLVGTGAVANDTLTFTALENGVTTSTSHVLTSYDISPWCDRDCAPGGQWRCPLIPPP